jgi:YD repeat-containing protein
LTDLTHTYDTTTIADYHWDYDAFGRVTYFSYDFSDGDDGSSTYTYDATGQLIDADHTAQADEEFEYDENGNRTMTGYDTDPNNLLVSDGVFDFAYDAEGNRVSRTRISTDPADDKTVEYEWDYRDRLTRVVFKDNAGDVTKEVLYEYDVYNRRITKIIDADGEGVGVAEQTDFIYDGQDIILAADGEGSLTNRYLHGPAIDQILADEQIAEEQMLWLLADNLGSVRDLVNNDGEVESKGGQRAIHFLVDRRILPARICGHPFPYRAGGPPCPGPRVGKSSRWRMLACTTASALSEESRALCGEL